MDFMKHSYCLALINFLAHRQEEINAGNVARGFWEESINPFEKPILAQTELSEAIDYHRKGKFGNEWRLVEEYKEIFNHIENGIVAFDKTLKGTVIEEIADTAIRVADFWGIDIHLLTFSSPDSAQAKAIRKTAHGHHVSDTRNFCERAGAVMDECGILKRMLIPERGVGQLAVRQSATTIIYMLAELAEDFTGNVEILIEVIEAKLRYNAERPYKHGKTH